MPRPILSGQHEAQSQELSKLHQNFETEKANQEQKKHTLTDPLLATVLRKPRSPEIIKLLGQLDQNELKLNPLLVKQLKEAINHEFPQIDLPRTLIGIVGKCYLGGDYDVHTLTNSLTIVHHYQRAEKIPAQLAVARNLAENPHYLYVEVYADCLRAVDTTGKVAEVPLK